jgi:hypothetical protein
VNERGRIPLSSITKMFVARENPAHMVQRCREELGFARRKVGAWPSSPSMWGVEGASQELTSCVV